MAYLNRFVADVAQGDANQEDIVAQVVAELLFDLIAVEDGSGGDGNPVVGVFLDGELFIGGGKESGRKDRKSQECAGLLHATDCIIRQSGTLESFLGSQAFGVQPKAFSYYGRCKYWCRL